MYKEKYDYTREPNKELIDFIKNEIKQLNTGTYNEYNPFESDNRFLFELNGVNYDIVELDVTDWIDEGKYQYQDMTYQLVSFNNNEYDYSNENNIIDKFNLFFILPVTRSGSYFTDYYYQYDSPTIHRQKIIHVPEQIIPAHDEYEMEEI